MNPTVGTQIRKKMFFFKTLQIVIFFLNSSNSPPPLSSQDPFLYSVCSADLLPDLVRASFWARECHLVPGLLLPLPVNADGQYVMLTPRAPSTLLLLLPVCTLA